MNTLLSVFDSSSIAMIGNTSAVVGTESSKEPSVSKCSLIQPFQRLVPNCSTVAAKSVATLTPAKKNVICKFGVPNWQQSHDINVFWTKHINLTRDSTGGVASHLGRPHMRHRLERHDCEYQSCRVGMEGSEVLTTLQGCKFPKQFVQESPTSQVCTSLLLYQDA